MNTNPKILNKILNKRSILCKNEQVIMNKSDVYEKAQE